ncbi:ABC transporter ATP-binding protein, partial [Agrobacterium tumefaciens]|uniref:ABC transporter ATP-binding protein n=1 Tax=Agrobacterium tumefaciens TaxID=358 RepID=UPI003B9F0BAB
FNCVTGLLPTMQGDIVFDGAPIAGLAPERITQAGLVRTFQLARGFPRMSVFEHLMLYGTRQPGESLWPAYFNSRAAARREAELQERAWQVARRVKLDPVIDNLATDISGGQKKLLEIGRALMADPKMILLDEPMAGVNPTLSRDIAEQLALLRDEGMTILLIEQNAKLALENSHRGYVMESGELILEGAAQQLLHDPK